MFRGVSSQLIEDACDSANTALKGAREEQPVSKRIEAALDNFSVSLYRTLYESPHGAELMDENNRLCGDVAQQNYTNFQAMLAEEIEFAVVNEKLDLASADVSPKEAAETIRYGAIGLKSGATSTSQYQKRVQRFVRAYFAGLEQK